MDKINEDLSAFKDRYFGMENATVQEKWDELESELKRTMNKHIPQKTAAKPNSLPWFNRTQHRTSLQETKSVQGKEVKESKSSDDWNKFLLRQKELRKSLNTSQHDFVANNLTTSMKENTKQFWSYMKRLGQGETGVADLKVNNNIISGRERKGRST